MRISDWSSDVCSSDLDSKPSADLDPVAARLSDDGLHIVHGDGPAAIHVHLIGDARPGQPLAALVPLDADAPDRLEALARLLRGLHRDRKSTRLNSRH